MIEKITQETSSKLEAFNKSYLNDNDIFKAYSNPYNLTKHEFLLIMRTFFYSLMKSMIEEGKVYYLPPKMGSIGVYKTSNTKRFVNYEAYKKDGVRTYYKNYHSGGYIAKFFWNTNWVRFNVGDPLRSNLFTFKAPRYFTRHLSKQIKENNTINKYYDY